MTNSFRIERDSMGELQGPVDALYGAQTQRAIDNFPVSGRRLPARIIRALSLIKQSAAEVNLGEDALPPDIAAAYAHHLAPLQQTLAFSHRAARAFYREPERGFRAMKLPILRSLILKTYADGLPHTRLLTALAKLV